MSPELSKKARNQALSEIGSTIDPELGGLAAGRGRFQNHFLRDWAISVSQSLSSRNNFSLNPDLIVSPGIKTIQTAIQHQSKFDIYSGQMPGELAHEVHTIYSPQERLAILRQDRWPVKTNSEGKMSMTVYYAKDSNGLAPFAVERLLEAVKYQISPQYAKTLLEKWWPFLENTLLFDIFQNDINGDGLIETSSRAGDKLKDNKTWRDSHDAFIYGAGEGGIPEGPLTHFANNCFSIAGMDSGARLAEQLGNYGFAESLKRRKGRARERLHEKFWMKEEGCFASALDSNGRQIPVVTNESAIGLFTQSLYPEYAQIAAKRMMEDDLLTSVGTRTRSSKDPQFRTNGTSSYHRGTVWPQMDTMLAIGSDSYGLTDIADQIKQRTATLVTKPDFGCIELVSVSPNGELDYYRENGEAVACFSQSWVIHGVLGITAPIGVSDRQKVA